MSLIELDLPQIAKPFDVFPSKAQMILSLESVELRAVDVGLTITDVEQVLIGGAFGQYINIEKAIQIGLLPDAPWENFHYMGNTSVRGAYLSLLSRETRKQVVNIADMMTYLELSADNTFFEEFNAALFLPHTDESQFPTVMAQLEDIE